MTLLVLEWIFIHYPDSFLQKDALYVKMLSELGIIGGRLSEDRSESASLAPSDTVPSQSSADMVSLQ